MLAAVAALCVQGNPEGARRRGEWALPKDRCSDNSQQELFHSLRHIGLQGREQAMVGPLQDDEAHIAALCASTRQWRQARLRWVAYR